MPSHGHHHTGQQRLHQAEEVLAVRRNRGEDLPSVICSSLLRLPHAAAASSALEPSVDFITCRDVVSLIAVAAAKRLAACSIVVAVAAIVAVVVVATIVVVVVVVAQTEGALWQSTSSSYHCNE